MNDSKESNEQNRPTLNVKDVVIKGDILSFITEPDAATLEITLTGINVKSQIVSPQIPLTGGVVVEGGVRYELDLAKILHLKVRLGYIDRYSVQIFVNPATDSKLRIGTTAGEFDTKMGLVKQADVTQVVDVEVVNSKLNLRREGFVLRWDDIPGADIALCISVGPANGRQDEFVNLPRFPVPMEGKSYDLRNLPIAEMPSEHQYLATVTASKGDNVEDEELEDITQAIVEAKVAAAKAVAPPETETAVTIRMDYDNVIVEGGQGMLAITLAKHLPGQSPMEAHSMNWPAWPVGTPFPLSEHTQIVPEENMMYKLLVYKKIGDPVEIVSKDVTDVLKRISSDRVIALAQKEKAEAAEKVAEAEQKLKEVREAQMKLAEAQAKAGAEAKQKDEPVDEEKAQLKAAAKQANKKPVTVAKSLDDLDKALDQSQVDAAREERAESTGENEGSQGIAHIPIPRFEGTVMKWEKVGGAESHKISVFVCPKGYFGRDPEVVTYLLPLTDLKDQTSYDLGPIDFTKVGPGQKAITYLIGYKAGNRCAESFRNVTHIARLQRQARDAAARAEAAKLNPPVPVEKVETPDQAEQKRKEAEAQAEANKGMEQERRKRESEKAKKDAEVKAAVDLEAKKLAEKSAELDKELAQAKQIKEDFMKMKEDLANQLKEQQNAEAQARAKREAEEKERAAQAEKAKADEKERNARKEREDELARKHAEKAEADKKAKAEQEEAARKEEELKKRKAAPANIKTRAKSFSGALVILIALILILVICLVGYRIAQPLVASGKKPGAAERNDGLKERYVVKEEGEKPLAVDERTTYRPPVERQKTVWYKNPNMTVKWSDILLEKARENASCQSFEIVILLKANESPMALNYPGNWDVFVPEVNTSVVQASFNLGNQVEPEWAEPIKYEPGRVSAILLNSTANGTEPVKFRLVRM